MSPLGQAHISFPCLLERPTAVTVRRRGRWPAHGACGLRPFNAARIHPATAPSFCQPLELACLCRAHSTPLSSTTPPALHPAPLARSFPLTPNQKDSIWIDLCCRLLETRLLQRLRFASGKVYSVAASPYFGGEAPSREGLLRGEPGLRIR